MPIVYIFWEDIGKLATVLAGPKNVDIFVPNRYVFGHFPEAALKSEKEFSPSEFFGDKLIFFSEDPKELNQYAKKIARYPTNIAKLLDVPEEGLIKVVNSVKEYLRAKSEAEKQVTALFYQVRRNGQER
jgi:hypothetical protein